jgi:hypothetical protein
MPKAIANAVVPTAAVWLHERSIEFDTKRSCQLLARNNLDADALCNIEQERLAEAIILSAVEEWIDL